MKALVTLKNLRTDNCRGIVLRNLSRIMDIRIIEVNLQTKKLHFHYQDALAFENVRRELSRIGYPIKNGLSKFKRRNSLKAVS